MDNNTNNTIIKIPVETAVAAELFAQLPADSQEALIDLIKSLLSEK